MSDFRAAWWCRNGHVQTVWGTLFRHRRLALRRERLATDDGDFVDLDWLDGPDAAPVLLVLHGLEGSARSHYVTGLLGEARARGWRGAALNFRSCSGEPNRLPRFYHSGDTGDLDAVVRRLVEREPGLRLGAVGVSLGGNVLLKWLGERREAARARVRRAAAVSAPLDLAAAGRALDRGLNRLLYTRHFLSTLKPKSLAKLEVFPELYDREKLRAARTFYDFDNLVTAPLHGFRDTDHYWAAAACGPYLEGIRVPTLVLNARNDPFLPEQDLLKAARKTPPCVVLEFPRTGGHAGFLAAPFRRRGGWLARHLFEFLERP
jgi:hypothetical protein